MAMHLNLRSYPTIGTSRGTIEKAVHNELLPTLQSQSGFEAYFAFWDQAGAGVSVSLFADVEAAHLSTDAVRRWLASHLDFFPARGEEFSGECFMHEEAPRRATDAADPPYLLIRVLSGVPGTQDTRAFVEQRTLPLIARSPGFQAVWMARSDREAGDALVTTLFDGPSEAMACHGLAVRLLHEGLPAVSVTKVMHGRAVIACLGAA
ncbi:hypothetical protein [Falsiroseomonas sp.]|uniref:hypothetical protein n=1 Tax=Falsiroseomonas sp. TaxID=2870721 RepID=UPI00356AD5D0